MAPDEKAGCGLYKRLCPAIAIEQKVITRTPRSTVGSMTEIYDYLRLLFARVGKTISPVSGREVKKDDVKDVVEAIKVIKRRKIKYCILSAFKQHEPGCKRRIEYLNAKRFFKDLRISISLRKKRTVEKHLRIEDLLQDEKDL